MITGVACDEKEIMVVRSRLLSHIGMPYDGSLTMQDWLFHDYWSADPVPPLKVRMPPDRRLIRETEPGE